MVLETRISTLVTLDIIVEGVVGLFGFADLANFWIFGFSDRFTKRSKCLSYDGSCTDDGIRRKELLEVKQV